MHTSLRRSWNLQVSNFDKGALANDPELGNAQSGARVTTSLIRDNANQGTGPDGTFPITNMFLWQPIAGSFYSPCVDGDYDMSVIGHEDTHAISNRMVAGPDRGLTGSQAGAMGESWGDLNGTEYLVENGFVPADQDPFVTGQYVTGNPDVGIRDFAISRNPLNYSDVGFDLTGPEVHADGEIWNGVNFTVRQAFVTKYGEGSAAVQAACAEGTRPLAECPGGRRWMQLVYDAFLLMANGNVSMIDARDAMIAADQLRFAGADVDLLADAFASRGLGQFAATDTNADTDPTPSFASATGNNGTVRFRLTGQGKDSTRAKIFVGDFQARAVPVADSDP